MTRRFEMQEGGSSKFWEITEDGASFTVRYGRIGTAGQSQTKDFASEDKARAAAQKLIAEKTGKGYVEVSGAPATTATPAAEKPAAKRPAKADEPKADEPKASKPAKAAKVEIPPLSHYSGKSMGSKALLNAAERFTAATKETWGQATEKLRPFDTNTVLSHLMAHGAFRPSARIHVVGIEPALMTMPPEQVLAVLSELTEPLVETLRTESPIVVGYCKVLARVHAFLPEELYAAPLPPTLRRLAVLLRALDARPVTAEEAPLGLAAAAELWPYGPTSIAFATTTANGYASDARIISAMAQLGGPHWVRGFAAPESIPTAVAVAALKDEPLEEVARALSMFNEKMLESRTEPAARFFEIAASGVRDDKAVKLRLRGMARASSPAEIPAGVEDTLRPGTFGDGDQLAALGTERLDAWAERWLAPHPGALEIGRPETDEEHAGYGIATGLRGMMLRGLPFGDALRRRLIGVPPPYRHVPDQLDHDAYLWRFSTHIPPHGAAAVLPLLAAIAREHDGDPKGVGLRLAFATVLRAVDGPIDPSYDALLSLGDAYSYDTKKAVRMAVYRLPVERAERVVARTAGELPDPTEELTYAREGASEAAMRRFARLVASGRQNELMWVAARGLTALGPAFGPPLAEALAGETLSESFFATLARHIDPAALAHVKEAVGKNVLDLRAELLKIAGEVGGETLTVLAMGLAETSTGLSQVGGVPAGFQPEDIPRHRGRKLLHAFTVDLNDAPELAARYPGARTLSVWIQGYSEEAERAQALITRTDAQIAAHPTGSPGSGLSLLRLTVPVAAFAPGDDDRAKYARSLLYRRPGFLLGGPVWLQDGPWGVDPEFVAQYDERLAPGANFGDYGVCYSFATRAEWQSH